MPHDCGISARVCKNIVPSKEGHRWPKSYHGRAARTLPPDGADPAIRGEGSGAVRRGQDRRLPAPVHRRRSDRRRRLQGAAPDRSPVHRVSRSRLGHRAWAWTPSASWRSCWARPPASAAARAARCTWPAPSIATGAAMPSSAGICRWRPAWALTIRYNEKPDAVLCVLGEGTTNIGYFHESINLAAVWKLPVVFLVENNQYGMGTEVGKASAVSEHLREGLRLRHCAPPDQRPGRVRDATRSSARRWTWRARKARCCWKR